MGIVLIVIILILIILIINFAVNLSINTKLLEENYKVVVEIRKLLKDQKES